MPISASQLRVAYNFLKQFAFYDIKLPRRMSFVARPLRRYEGYWYANDRIDIASGIKNGTSLLQVLAHEMCHAASECLRDTDHYEHGEGFRDLWRLICKRMGWRFLKRDC